jgi:3-isopropylmalate/(R)-2-methylmalate dehydratase small subunit
MRFFTTGATTTTNRSRKTSSLTSPSQRVVKSFGCGSSREHAPWALTSYGFRAVISTSFADIFRNNSLKNGLIPIIVDDATHKMLFDLVEEIPNVEFTVDLASQTLILPNGSVEFPIDPFNKTCLLNGVDELGYILGFEKEIAAFETKLN